MVKPAFITDAYTLEMFAREAVLAMRASGLLEPATAAAAKQALPVKVFLNRLFGIPAALQVAAVQGATAAAAVVGAPVTSHSFLALNAG